MTSSRRQGDPENDPLEEVLEDYMRRLDRGEAVDRELLLARHPELAAGLRSYFAASDEVERLNRTESVRWPAPATEGEGPPGRFGDYEVLEQIGQGGMGVIYRARQLSLQRLVALKVMRPYLLSSPVDVRRFRSEAESVASLDHPFIVPIFEVGEHHGQPFFSMKLIEGGNLAHHLDRLAVDIGAGVGILAAVARAVHYAHQRGILHRDLKPTNVLLDADGRPYVTDFGLAKRLTPSLRDASLTQQGAVVGTPNYMAPEQAAATGRLSTAVDVWALGAVLYEMLTGRPPFQAESPLHTLLEVQEREPTPPHTLNRGVDRDLETVCLKCLHKEPAKRYPSAEALAEDLERWQKREPIHARPSSTWEHIAKWTRRQPHLAAVAGLLVLSILAGFAGVWWQWRRAEGESQRAVAHARAEERTAYARAIALAYAEWRAGNAGPAERVLDACRPALRGWEWHYLRRLFRARQLATLTGHEEVLAVAFSPDGARIATGGADGAVKVWDPRNRRAVLNLAGQAAIAAVALSRDGRRLAAGSADGAVRVWDAGTGTALATWGGNGPVTGLAFDPSGQRLAATGGKPLAGELKLWDLTSGKALGGRTWRHLLAAVTFTPDGKFLATAGHDDTVTAWDAATLKPVLGFKGRTPKTVRWASVAFSADSRWIAAGSPDGLVRVWDAVTGQEHFTALTPTGAGVAGVAFGGPDGRILAAAAADNTIHGWFTSSGTSAFTLRGHGRAVTAVAFSPDGRQLASGSLDRTAKVWDVTRRDEDRILRPANAEVNAVAFSPDGTSLAAATRDRTVKVWNLATGKPVMTLRALPGSMNGLAFHPGGARLACAGGDGWVRVWEFPSGREALRLPCGAPVHTVAFHPSGARLACGGEDGWVRVWEVPAGRQALCLRCGVPVHAAAFHPDGRLVVGTDRGVCVWDGSTGQELPAPRGGRGVVHAVAFSPDGRHLATAGQDETVLVRDLASGARVRTLRGHAGAIRALAYGPGGRLASVGDDKAVRLWDPEGRELLALRRHSEALRAVAFSPDGHRLASGSDDGTVTIWNGTPGRSQGQDLTPDP
jgi:WD40 repeat protein/tRNA A-37 threonylcarbamoyl transferase component Bud32